MSEKSVIDYKHDWIIDHGQSSWLDYVRLVSGETTGADGEATIARAAGYASMCDYYRAKTGQPTLALGDVEKKYFASAAALPLQNSSNNSDPLARCTFGLTRSTTGVYYGTGGTILSAATNVARWSYDSGLGDTGLLVENARTNYVQNNHDFSGTGWAVISASASIGTGLTPTGSTGVMILTDDGTGSTVGRASQDCFTGSDISSGYWIASCWLKTPSGTGTAQLELLGYAPSVSRTKACVLGSTWTRFSFGTTFAAGTIMTFRVHNGANGTAPVAIVHAWNPQVEVSPSNMFCSSEIQNQTTGVTARALDEASIAGSDMTKCIKGQQGTVMLEFSPNWDYTDTSAGANRPGLFEILTAGTYGEIRCAVAGDAIKFLVKDADGTYHQAWVSTVNCARGHRYKVACAWDCANTVYTVGSNSYYAAAYVSTDGGAWVPTDTWDTAGTAFSMPTTIDTCVIGREPGGGADVRYLFGNIHNFKTSPRAMALADFARAW